MVGLSLLFYLAFIVITVSEKLYEMSEDHHREFLVWDNERVIDYDAYVLATEDYKENKSDE